MTSSVATLCWLFFIVLVSQASSQTRSPPPTPCPAVFRYEYDSSAGAYRGIVTIVPPARFSEAQLVLRLDLPYYRPDAGVGRVEIRGGNRQVQVISSKAASGVRQKLEYIVIFPPFDDLPRVAGVTINGKNFCPQTQANPGTRGTIELKYSLKTGLHMPLASGSQFSVYTTSTQPDSLDESPEAPQRPHQGVPTTESSIEVIIVEIPNNVNPDNIHTPINNHPKPPPDTFVFPGENQSGNHRPNFATTTFRPSSMNSQQIDERIVALLTSISKGETVASARIESLLERLLILSKKRYNIELERLRIEKERLHLESG